MSELAGENVRRGAFGDFMFGTPIHRDESSSSSSEMPPRHNHSEESPSSDQNNQSGEHSIDCSKSRWQNSIQGNTQTKICWADGNMWEFRMRPRRK
ncbi:hypothetical protein [Neobacillus cucumis]|uniref:Uncharacterized protein n=1 Tax=Neobacillus cucumis TaxID=1740721 RepID=A0A2N5H662_9BACI|nr:hypothetical protein [Neobacillus cucumis]PLS00984.1 hypothetical protein CVD27_27620 [Neobacillus cucumis]